MWLIKIKEDVIVEYKKLKDGSFILNCILRRRVNDNSDYLFRQSNESVSVFLNGYAIIPIEEYFELKGEADDELLKQVEVASKQLYT